MVAELDYAPAIARCLTDPEEPGEPLVKLVREVLAMDDYPSRAALEAMQERIAALLPSGDELALVYGGATKIKEYVFEAPKLPEIRGASALLDWVNEVDLPRLWGADTPGTFVERGILYASGGNILAFAPAARGPDLASSIERSYTTHTLTANSVAVSMPVSLLELRFGRAPLRYWVDDFARDWGDPELRPTLELYYYLPDTPPPAVASGALDATRWRFFNRKKFGELVTVLASLANRRREERARFGEPRDVPRFELLPWAAKCDSSDLRPAVFEDQIADELTTRQLSEPTARKRYVGQLVKVSAELREDVTRWFPEHFGPWSPDGLRERSWEQAWLRFLKDEAPQSPYALAPGAFQAEPASDVGQVGQASDPDGYIGMIYADGDNVGRLIATLSTPAQYHRTSLLLRDAARSAVFAALAQHLAPVRARDTRGRERLVHPFEILSIGGDDLLVIVPGSLALPIALTAGLIFERKLAEALPPPTGAVGTGASPSRYHAGIDVTAAGYTPAVGLSAGVIIGQENTPIFFLRDLAEDLQKRAKTLAKANAKQGFYGGAVDFMVLKSVTMVSNDIGSFRRAALGVGVGRGARADGLAWDGDAGFRRPLQEELADERRLTARPYTWHEFAGLLDTARALRAAGMPRSQLYRLRQSLDATEAGITTSVVEYLYTRARLRPAVAEALRSSFEQPWHHALLGGAGPPALPPWMPLKGQNSWESVWPDLLELYSMIPAEVRP